VTAIANLIARITAEAAPPSQNCYPGNHVNYTITVTNEGNGDDIADLQIYDLPLGWTYEFSSTSSYLDPFQEVSVELRIHVPENALADSDPSTPVMDPYRIGINITGREKALGYGETLYVNLLVEKISDLRLTTVSANKFASPRSVCDFIFRLDNMGNAVDVGILNITRDLLDDDWKVYFPYLSLNRKMDSLSTLKAINFTGEIDVREFGRDILYIPQEDTYETLKLKLDVRDTIYIAVYVEIPEVSSGENVSFSVVALSEDESTIGDNIIDFTIEIIMPDLYIREEITSTSMSVGKIASFTAHVENKGDLVADDVSVTLFVDNKEVDTRMLPRVDVGDRKLVTFVWPVSEGKHNIKVAVDPENVIAETDENNNVKYHPEVDVKSNKGVLGISMGSSSTPWIVFGLILIGLSGAAIAYSVHHFKHKY